MRNDSPKEPTGGALRFRKAFLLFLAVGISVLFLLVIRPFLLSVFLAAIFAGLTYPLYGWVLERFGGRKALSAVTTLLLLLVGVGVPLAGFLTLVAAEAVQVSQGAEAWFRDQAPRLDQLRSFVRRIPFADRLVPESDQIAQQFREVAGRTGPALMGAVAAATRGTLNFVLQVFILFYALFYFLVDGPSILRKILHYIPLAPGEKEQLMERFVSVSRATLRGSLLIGVIQGGVAGLAFWVAGVPGPAFWGTVMVVLSIIPAVGAALIWIPAVIYLFMVGQVAAGVGLLVWCAIVVSTLDNFLRPRLIGRDARMSDLLILLSTLGGILVFGAVGFIVGPIVAALFVTVWHIYGEAFQDWLPQVPEAAVAAVTTGVGTERRSVGEGEGAARQTVPSRDDVAAHDAGE
jgi:predicted PurR-regulated permease PerM